MAVLVVIRKGADRDQWISALNAAALTWSDFPNLPRIFRVSGIAASSFPLKDHPSVETIEDDSSVEGADQPLSIAADLSGASWGIARVIRRRAPWPTSRLQFPINTYFRCERDGAAVDIYSFDTGIRTSHAEFGGRATNVYEFYSSGGLGDDEGHGTGTSSIACGATVGLARGASIFSFKCLDSANSGTTTALIAAISEALTHYNGRSGPAVANMSLTFSSSAANTAVGDLIDAGMVVVAAAANDKTDLGTIDRFPAEVTDVICVGGIGPADIPYYTGELGTNWGTRVDVSAPSQNVWLANNTGDSDYIPGFGTSQGCPFAAGAVACMLQGHARLTGRTQVQAIRTHVIATATTGRISNPPSLGITLPDRILYLDPNQTAPEAISGL